MSDSATTIANLAKLLAEQTVKAESWEKSTESLTKQLHETRTELSEERRLREIAETRAGEFLLRIRELEASHDEERSQIMEVLQNGMETLGLSSRPATSVSSYFDPNVAEEAPEDDYSYPCGPSSSALPVPQPVARPVGRLPPLSLPNQTPRPATASQEDPAYASYALFGRQQLAQPAFELSRPLVEPTRLVPQPPQSRMAGPSLQQSLQPVRAPARGWATEAMQTETCTFRRSTASVNPQQLARMSEEDQIAAALALSLDEQVTVQRTSSVRVSDFEGNGPYAGALSARVNTMPGRSGGPPRK